MDNVFFMNDELPGSDANGVVEGNVAADAAGPVVPPELAILPTGEGVVFPFMVFPMVVREERAVRLINDVAAGNRMLGLFPLSESGVEPAPDTLNPIGTAAVILRLLRGPDGSLQLIVRGLSRIRCQEITQTEPYFRGRVEVLEEVEIETTEVEALQRSLFSIFQRIVALSPALPNEAAEAAGEVNEPGRLADFVANALNLSLTEKLELLAAVDIVARLRRTAELASRELEVLELGSEIQDRIRAEMDKGQREYYLREQLRQIQAELGDLTGEQTEVGELRDRIEQANLPEGARKEAEGELSRLERIPPASPEYGIIRTYIDWIVSLPWSVSTPDNLDLGDAQRILDEDHYDLERIKERILEYLAVHKLRGEVKGPILCFVGPPGVGKTSLGQSIARALGRKFVRISLGGVRDEAEIRGHRRTYIGAMPGRIIQGLRRAGTNNPVFMLDEIDKVTGGFQGDPAAALLEVLDPAQNSTFSDHYLDIPFDLSRILFVATANVLDTIPAPLRDRMEIIDLAGYTEQEKLQIARRYLVPRQLKENGVPAERLEFDDSALRRIIEQYTREAGVRGLERQIGTVARKVARRIAQDNVENVRVTQAEVGEYLGPTRIHHEVIEQQDEVGVATGLAWTPTGGDVLFVEASMIPGRGNMVLTGQLGEVMQESARAAMTYVRSQAKSLGVDDNFWERNDFHVHVPAGAIPKDGPSAGITMATAIASAVSNRRVNKEVAMTGEITLRGRVLPIGGLKEKVLAAHRAGARTIVIPAENERDLDDLPEDIRQDLKFVLAGNMGQVLETSLLGDRPRKSRPRRDKAQPEPVAAASA